MFRSLCFSFLSLSLALPIFAADKDPVYTSAAEAGADFALQGEYLGKVHGDDWGAQVVALGDGKFDVVGYKGGLPGAGWKFGDERKKGSGELKNGVVNFTSEKATGTISSEMLVLHVDGREIGQMKKIERVSPTIGAQAPSGATILFDGRSTDAWLNGELMESNLLAATNAKTKEKYQDFTLHVEFRTPFMPLSRGQKRGNSGVYMQGRYECQVLDSFGLEGVDNECGGIYKVSRPKVNMCLPPLAWQTYDIVFVAARYDDAGTKTKNARVTIRHNGIVIHDNLEIPKETPGYQKEAPEPCEIFLQNHGNPVAFRNIWIVAKK
jgi:Domain of Unknown Function (DUF1080)